ncbi:uncharacterized protein LOC129919703 [Episyrphus balteatus]|uniref:uncharacterized protein LOC129919703 n=1 Tax=Episyrphus balteatus TaxID=286459 RepID=UPI0024859A61|nr:uncharacterized protein LOC129919703 [Episyrphus balteatus]
MGFRIIHLLIFCMYFIHINGRYYEENEEGFNSISNEDTTVKPVCYPSCENNGICVEDSICKCPENFLGLFCELQKTRECFSFEKENEFCSSAEHDDMTQCDMYCFYSSANEKQKLSTTTPRKEITSTTTESHTRQYPKHTSTNNDISVSEIAETDSEESTTRSNECSFEPPLSKNAQHILMHSSYQKVYKIKCFSGYSFPDGSKVEKVYCLDGRWYNSKNEYYIPQDCQENSSNEINFHNEYPTTNNYERNDETTAKLIESNDEEVVLEPFGCTFEPPLSKNAKHNLFTSGDTKKSKVQCLPGFSFTDGSKVHYLECKDGKWQHISSGDLKAPDCEEISNKVYNHDETTTEVLEPNGCRLEPPLSKNAKHIRVGSNKYKVQCFSGFKFSDGSKVQYLECDNGNWRNKVGGGYYAPDCDEDYVSQAFRIPHYRPTNLQTTTDNSNKVELNSCPFQPPISENAKHIRLGSGGSTKYKIKCFTGYSFPDGTKVQHMECKNGKWYHQETEDFEVPHCQETQCEYEGFKHKSNYKEVRPGNEFLELCTCQKGIWNCTKASEEDKEKYPSSSDFEAKCEENPILCEVESSNVVVEKCEKSKNTEMNNSNSILELLKYALGLSSEREFKQNSKDSKLMSVLKENKEIPGIKVVSLNFQSVEILGNSEKNKEKDIK